jgi:plastocyanin
VRIVPALTPSRSKLHPPSHLFVITLPGQSETWTVTLAPGTYRYHCDVDPDMKGSFTVTS